MKQLDWKKILGQILRIVIAAALGGTAATAVVSNNAVPSFLVADPQKQPIETSAFKVPIAKGNDYALTVSYDIANAPGLPGQKCIQQIATITLRGGIGNYKQVEQKARDLITAAFGSKLCPEALIYVSVGGAVPYGYYGDRFAVITQPLYEAQQPVGKEPTE